MPSDDQLQEHRGQKEDEGDIPRDNVLEVVVVDFRVRVFYGLVDGVVCELRRNR